ncbi:MAG: type IV pilus secretin PilQ [Bradymonadaceae bacterium]|nr:type IV pilus secretin PilQ [Lujinxingiaceae bacterium]
MRWKLSILLLCVMVGLSTPAFAQADRSAGATQLNTVATLKIDERDDGTYIALEGSEVPTFSVFKLNDPLRLFVDISNSKIKGDSLTRDVGNGVISKVALIEFEDSFQTVTRLIIGFDRGAHYDVRTEGNKVVVFVDGAQRNGANKDMANVERELQTKQKQLAAAESQLRQTEERYQGELKANQTRFDQAVGELESTRARLESNQAEIKALEQRLSSTSGAERREVESAIAKKNDALEIAQREVAKSEKTVSGLRKQLDALTSERDQATARAERLDEQRKLAIEKAQQAEAARERALALARVKEEEGTHAKKRADELQSNLTQTRAELDDVATQKEAFRARVSTMTEEAKQASTHVDTQRRQLDEARKREAELERQVSALRAAGGDQSAQASLKELEKERNQWQDRSRQYTAQLDEAQKQSQGAQTRLGEMQKLIEQRDTEIAQLREAMTTTREQQGREQLAAVNANTERLQAINEAIDRERQRVEALEGTRRSEEARLTNVKQARSDEEGRLAKIQGERAVIERELGEARAQLEASQRQLANSNAGRASLVPARAVAVDATNSNTVRAIRLETTAQGRSRIVVELDHPGKFETLPWKDSRAVMILNDVQLPKHLEKTLSSSAQGGAVRFVSSFADKPGQVRVEAELRADASEVIRQEGNQLVWEFASAVAGGASTRHAQEVAPKAPVDGQSFTSAPPGYPLVVADPTRVSSVPGMSRKRLTIDLRNADIQNVLRLMAKEGGVNIIASDGVKGSVTMRLRSVPLDQVFLTILQSLQLGFEVRGNVIRVAPQGVLNQEEGARAAARAAAQRVQPLEVFLLPINYASADEMVGQVNGLLSSRGSVTVDKRTNTLIIKDLRENLDAIRMLVESLDSQVPQVLIEARIVETNDTFARQIGIQWGGDISFSQGNGNPTGLIFPNVLGIGGGATDGQTPTAGTSSNPNFAVNLPAPAGTGAGGAIGLTMGSVGGGVNLNLRLSAMEEAGHAKIVSSPRILTMDNKQATISQGTSIPISVVSAAGVQTVFVDATLELTVTPHVTPDGNVQLTIQATKNEPDFQNTGARGDPTIIRRQANTELLIRDGDTTVIGGIYTRNAGQSIAAVPFFHRIPILGFFFRTSSQSERRSELLIFITPRIVNRAEALGMQSAGSISSDFGGEE